MLIEPGDIVPPSGSIEGFTVQTGKRGPFLLARTQHVKPRSPAQQTLAGHWRNAGGRWTNVLTPVQRDAWAVYAALTPIPHPVKGTVFLSPSAMYMRTAIVRATVGLAPVNDAPVIFDLGTFTVPTISATAPDEITVTFNEIDDWVTQDGAALVIHEHNPTNITVNHQRNRGRNTGAIFGSSSTPPTSPQSLTTKAIMTGGNGAHFEARVALPDGRVTPKTRIDGILVSALIDCNACFGAPCPDCPDGQPEFWGVRYTGMIPCPCINCGGVESTRSYKITVDDPSLAGAPLDQFVGVDNCFWRSRAPLQQINGQNFPSVDDCTGPFFGTTPVFQTQLHRRGGVFTIEGLLLNLGATGICQAVGIYFKAEVATPSCCKAFTAVNQLAGRPCGGLEQTFAQGGATIIAEASSVLLFPCPIPD